eukprot:882837_1
MTNAYCHDTSPDVCIPTDIRSLLIAYYGPMMNVFKSMNGEQYLKTNIFKIDEFSFYINIYPNRKNAVEFEFYLGRFSGRIHVYILHHLSIGMQPAKTLRSQRSSPVT